MSAYFPNKRNVQNFANPPLFLINKMYFIPIRTYKNVAKSMDATGEANRDSTKIASVLRVQRCTQRCSDLPV